jgi:hypothetical protein
MHAYPAYLTALAAELLESDSIEANPVSAGQLSKLVTSVELPD